MDKIIASNIVYKSKWMKVYEDCVKSKKDDKSHIFNRITMNHNVGVIPVFPDGSLLMIENYRHGVDAILLELPGGLIEKDEAPSETARRELFEETGYICNVLEPAGWIYTWPAKVNQKIYIFLAKFLEKRSEQNLDRFESAKVYILSRKEVLEEIKNGNIKSAETISVLVHGYLKYE